tara:strand:- start:57220 stop:57765 length:546 start_codon:yes stop_codon:yes gene_type:complete
MRRRDFFSSLAEASMDLLGDNPFHGTLADSLYTFVPATYKNSPTLLVMGGLRLRENVYKDKFNLIYMDKWPTHQADVSFWRKLLLRHDLTDQIFVLCKTLPDSAPSFMMKAVCLDKNSAARENRNLKTLPVMLLVGEDKVGNGLPNLEHFGHGSDVFVSSPNTLNIQGSPAYDRVVNFFLG